jgi:hypothetical protein
VLTKPTPLKVLLPAVLGVLIGASARGPEGIGWILALIFISSAVTAIVQQTLPWGPNAVYGIASSDVYRNKAGRSWITKAIVYSFSSALAGVVMGAILGAVGSLLALDFRLALGSVLAAVAVAVGGLEFIGRRVQLPQFDCETPQRWVHRGPLSWATRNGLILGFGATSRIGFWLWYAIPLGAFLVGDPAFGAVSYGTYSLLRALGAVFILLSMLGLKIDVSDWLIERYGAARALAAGQLVLLGVATAIVVGL